MARTVHRLSARQVAASKPGLRPDGGNLYLQTTMGGEGNLRRSWLFRYELNGCRHDMGLGATHTITLAEAREAARKLRQDLIAGIDPLAVRQAARAERLAAQAERARTMTFRQCFEACLAAHADSWRSREHRVQWRTSIETYVLPTLGDLAVDDIGTPHIIKVLEPIWGSKPETASRVRGRIEKILAWATVRQFRSGDNPARWSGHLAEMFPSVGKVAPIKHLPALPYTDVPAFVAQLRSINHPAARALEFAALTAARTSEVLDATWDEFDLAAKVWTIPAARMKAHKEHRIPLSAAALELLSRQPRHGERVFPCGQVSMQKMMRRVRSDGATVHGLRSSFRDWAAERTNYPSHVVEQALAHSIGSKVERAYHRSDLFEKRRRLMNEWATWCSRPVPAGATVVTLAG